MFQDLDRLLREAELDALVVLGGTADNAAMRYFVPRGRLSGGLAVKKPDQPPSLWVSAMEREEAGQSEWPVHTWSEAGFYNFLQETRDRNEAWVRTLATIFQKEGLTTGRIAVVGRVEFGTYWSLFHRLQDRMPGLTLLGEEGLKILLEARATKSPEEVERIRALGQATVEVVGRVWEWLGTARVRDGLLVDAQGEVLTIGRVKRQIRLWMLEQGADLPYGLIFAQGRDAGIPHSMGEEAAPLRAGQPIVFDIFPREANDGYFFDFTRTWTPGYATPEAEALYAQVLEAHHLALETLQAGQPAHEAYDRVCDYFEARGHPTLRTEPGTQQGFVHSLGHGLGLDIHEAPTLRQGNTQPLKPGHVVTVEPGLYYPEQGMGFRVEDTVWMDESGRPRVLVEFPYDFVLPLRG